MVKSMVITLGMVCQTTNKVQQFLQMKALGG